MSHQKTLSQERAAQAVADVHSVSEKAQAEYDSLVRGLPILIWNDGLGDTLLFLKAKGKEHHLAAYKHISNWVMKQVAKQDGDLLTWLLAENSFMFRRATEEAIEYLKYLKRFAEARGIDV